MTADKAASALFDSLSDQKWLITVATAKVESTGHCFLYVYSNDIYKAKTIVPKVWHGYKVLVKHMEPVDLLTTTRAQGKAYFTSF